MTDTYDPGSSPVTVRDVHYPTRSACVAAKVGMQVINTSPRIGRGRRPTPTVAQSSS